MNSRFNITTAALVLAILLIVMGCGGGSSGDDTTDNDNPIDDEQVATLLTQYTNPDDRLMLTADTENGEKLAYYGTKNASGEPISLDAVSYQTSEQVNTGAATWLYFNDTGQLIGIEGESGTSVSVDEVSEFEYVVSAVSGDGETQAITIVELDAQTTSNQIAVHSQRNEVPENEWLAKNGNNFERTHGNQALLREKLSRDSVVTSGSDNYAYAHASVFECGNYEGVEGAYVYFTASKPGDPYPPAFLAVEEQNGRYKARIPLGNEPLTAEAISNACTELTNVLSVSCDATGGLRGAGSQVFCASLAAALDTLIAGPTGEGVLIFTECEAGFIALDAYCSASGATPEGMPGTGLPGPTNYLCDNIGNIIAGHPGVQQAIDMNQLEVQAYAKLPGRGIKTSDTVILNPFTEEFPSFVVDFGGDIEIKEISVSPAIPCRGESYSATIKLSCSAESAVTIEVVHEDETTTRHEFSPTDDTPITVEVPGSSSARDVIRLLAVSPEMGPLGFITASRDLVVAFQDCGDDSTDPDICDPDSEEICDDGIDNDCDGDDDCDDSDCANDDACEEECPIIEGTCTMTEQSPGLTLTYWIQSPPPWGGPPIPYCTDDSEALLTGVPGGLTTSEIIRNNDWNENWNGWWDSQVLTCGYDVPAGGILICAEGVECGQECETIEGTCSVSEQSSGLELKYLLKAQPPYTGPAIPYCENSSGILFTPTLYGLRDAEVITKGDWNEDWNGWWDSGVLTCGYDVPAGGVLTVVE